MKNNIVKEAGRTPPPFPFIFFKPTTCISDHDANVVIPKIAQDDQADYEGELVRSLPFPSFFRTSNSSSSNLLSNFNHRTELLLYYTNPSHQCLIIGKDAKDVSREDALSYVGAYTVGNDISSRKLQRDPAFAGRIPQWGFSKGFDTFAPLGPCLVNPDLIGDPAELHVKTIVNGVVRQDESVGDLLFDCAYLISYLSSGTTLRKGSVIMTGTPGGEWFILFSAQLK
jgi:2-keto-4-pentenoate hydratase/2-oxohepta-3-ene-1,7-dioic acid hydratase in catechol pathway